MPLVPALAVALPLLLAAQTIEEQEWHLDALDIYSAQDQARGDGVIVATPHVAPDLPAAETERALKSLLDGLLACSRAPLIRWYYTPMMLPFSRHLDAVCTVYDCMDELANFRFAPKELLELERELLATSDVVFTGGYSLYEAKKGRHPNVHPFPSSVVIIVITVV